MFYISPYRVLGVSADADVAAIQRARRRVLAELDLKQSASVWINGVEVDRTLLEQMCAELLDPERRFFHAALAQEKYLLQFLETGQLVAGQSVLPSRHELIFFCKKYFLSRYDESLARALASRDAVYIHALRQAASTLGYHDEVFMLPLTADQLQREMLSLQSLISGRRETLHAPDHFLKHDLIALLNSLPESLQFIREEYGILLAQYFASEAGMAIHFDSVLILLPKFAVLFPQRSDLLVKLVRLKLELSWRRWWFVTGNVMSIMLFLRGLSDAVYTFMPRTGFRYGLLIAGNGLFLVAFFISLYAAWVVRKHEPVQRSRLALLFTIGFLVMPLYWFIELRHHVPQKGWWMLLLMLLGWIGFFAGNI